MQFYSVLTKKEYVDEAGKDQTQWFKAGFLKVTPRGGRYLQLFHQPDTTYFLAPQDEDQEATIELDP